MKTSSVSLCFLTATLFAIPAFAQDAAGDNAVPPPPPGEVPPPPPPHPRFDREREGPPGGPRGEHGRDRDRDRDDEAGPRGPGGPRGFGGPEGRPDFRRMIYQHEELVHRFDQDGDGHLNEAERAEARKAGEAKREHAKEMRTEMLQRFDRNGDGRLDESERTEMRAAWEDFIKSRPILAPKATTK